MQDRTKSSVHALITAWSCIHLIQYYADIAMDKGSENLWGSRVGVLEGRGGGTSNQTRHTHYIPTTHNIFYNFAVIKRLYTQLVHDIIQDYTLI